MQTPRRQEQPRKPVLSPLLAAALLGWLFLWIPSVGRHAGRKPSLFHGFGASRASAATPDSEAESGSVRVQRSALLETLGVNRWHAAGYRGQGVKVAVLDSGFCGYRAHLGKELPARVLTHSFRLDGNLEARDSQHGILCAEVVHALAPEAELLFANWETDRPETFLEAVRWAKQQGVCIITCSVIMPSWSDGEGHGEVHQTLRRLLGDPEKGGSILCFASAGNTAQRHWCGTFHDSGDGRHEWGRGEAENVIRPWSGDQVSVELYWRGSARYGLTVREVTTGRVVGERSGMTSPAHCCTAVRFTPDSGRAYAAEVRLAQGEPGRFHLVALGGGLAHATRKSSIPFPGDGPEIVAVGAVTGEGRRLGYSSCGPNSDSPKPDLVAAVPFPSAWRLRPFTGTSAASPQAAGLAALLWSKNTQWTAAQVREALKKAASAPGKGTPDFEKGYGHVRLP